MSQSTQEISSPIIGLTTGRKTITLMVTVSLNTTRIQLDIPVEGISTLHPIQIDDEEDNDVITKVIKVCLFI